MAEPNYSSLVGKVVCVRMNSGRAHIRGRLLRWRLIPGGAGCHSAVIRRRSGNEVFISGRFPLERAP